MELAIETKNLKKYYGNIHAVDGINLQLLGFGILSTLLGIILFRRKSAIL